MASMGSQGRATRSSATLQMSLRTKSGGLTRMSWLQIQLAEGFTSKYLNRWNPLS